MTATQDLLDERADLVRLCIACQAMIDEMPKTKDPRVSAMAEKLKRSLAVTRSVIDGIDEVLFGALPGQVSH